MTKTKGLTLTEKKKLAHIQRKFSPSDFNDTYEFIRINY